MRLRNGTFLTVVLFGLCGLISLSWYTAFSNSKENGAIQWISINNKVYRRGGTQRIHPPYTTAKWLWIWRTSTH
uniref:Alpha-1,3-mannosyl-glycoprotein 4-beta-N-acetylglucosaminyltransferase B n=1 Tax=Salmo salar TaxID=8030 RepID=B9EN49_SALSA|nr:Alpha-1,3-mannosyl-glycoprotein 4-beta-N-acetylglucosaminyltransferase B [Salmo salar]|eukprot:NP_001139969.1 Alpha-1,3-mannosyl-glycoprotein 4-beta-N-acetylglucosaminyltransferase B [Salmo salar]